MSTFSWSNPHLGGSPGILRDPFILHHGGRWYLTASSRPFWDGPVDGVPLWVSDDLVTWRRLSDLIRRDDLPGDAWFRDRLWAPELHAVDERIYLTVNGRNDSTRHRHSVALAVADDITGPYRVITADRPLVTLDQERMTWEGDGDRYLANDGTLVTVAPGEHYVAYSSSRGIHARRVDLGAGETSGQEITITTPHPGRWDGHVEGPSIVRLGGRLVCFYSSFTRGYEVGVLYADSMHGPWVPDPDNPIVGPRGRVTAAGHNCVFVGPDGAPWIAYHVEVEQVEGERLAIDPLHVGGDGRVTTPAPTEGGSIP